jgi:acyl phosphate:glycerol-3-phosphate acyltransferase
MNEVLFLVVAYLIGSLSFAVIVSRMFGLPDPHSYGSGNPGATNVLRTGKRSAAALTLLGDAGKGWVAVMLAKLLAAQWNVGEGTIAGVALFAFVGHLWPVFFGFRGGKGVATAGGILLAVNPWLGLGTIATWLIIAFFFRYSSLAALVSALFAPIGYVVLFRGDTMSVAIGLISLLLIWRHAANIGRLLQGTEGKIGAKSNTGNAGEGAEGSGGDAPGNMGSR